MVESNKYDKYYCITKIIYFYINKKNYLVIILK